MGEGKKSQLCSGGLQVAAAHHHHPTPLSRFPERRAKLDRAAWGPDVQEARVLVMSAVSDDMQEE